MRAKILPLFILLAAVTLVAPTTAKKPAALVTPAVPPATDRIGIAVRTDASSVAVFGQALLDEMYKEFVEGLNLGALMGGAYKHFDPVGWRETPVITNANRLNPPQLTVDAKKSAAFWADIGAVNADEVQFWLNSSVIGFGIIPTAAKHFQAANGMSVSPTGGPREQKVHEGHHPGGLQHNDNKDSPPGASLICPKARGEVRADGTCDAVSYCKSPGLWLSKGNADCLRTTGVLLASYDLGEPVVKAKCDEGIDSVCLRSRFLARVFFPDSELEPEYGTRRVSEDGLASFVVTGLVVRVTAPQYGVRVGRKTVTLTNFGMVVPATLSVPVRIIINDTRDNKEFAWDFPAGKGTTYTAPAPFLP